MSQVARDYCSEISAIGARTLFTTPGIFVREKIFPSAQRNTILQIRFSHSKILGDRLEEDVECREAEAKIIYL